MSKKPAPPEMTEAQINQNPPAEPRVDEKPPLERVSDEIRHHRAGLSDPTPSVKRAFAEAPPPSEPDEETAGSEYVGPWVVNNRFPVMLNGLRQTIAPTMPLPGGGRGRRILEVGDIPNELAQELWANGTISPKPLVAPKPKRPRL